MGLLAKEGGRVTWKGSCESEGLKHTEIIAWERQVGWSRHGSYLRPKEMVALCTHLKITVSV